MTADRTGKAGKALCLNMIVKNEKANRDRGLTIFAKYILLLIDLAGSMRA